MFYVYEAQYLHKMYQYNGCRNILNNDNHVDFCMVSFISHMHPTLINAIACVTGVIELLC